MSETQSVYVVVAVDEDQKVKECVVFSDLEEADKVFKFLKGVWGGANVALASRGVDNVPPHIVRGMNRPEPEPKVDMSNWMRGFRWA